MRKISLFVTFLLLFHCSAFAVGTDETPTPGEVETLIGAASPGDTITFLGNATWTETCTIGKGITIDLNGHTLTADGALDNTGFFEITGFEASGLVRVTGGTMDLVNCDASKHAIYVHDMAGGVSVGNIRIDHNTFHHGYSTIEYAHGKGLIDNNYFYNARKAIASSAGSRANGDESWVSLAAGTVDATYIEDNNFIINGSYTLGTASQEQIGTYAGGKLVVRYNTFTGTSAPSGYQFDPFMAHGNADGGCETQGYWEQDEGVADCIRRGQSVIEFYKNTINAPDVVWLYQSRGSVNLVWDNDLTTDTASPGIYLWEEEYGSNYPVNTRIAWPAEDTIHNSHIWGNTFGGEAYFNQAAHIVVNPSNNNCTGSGTPYAACTGSGTGTIDFDEADAFIKLGRDVWLAAPASSGGTEAYYANSDCVGVDDPHDCCEGSGTGHCMNGAAGTDPTDGDPYANFGTLYWIPDVVQAYYGYEPYTYPHPLNTDFQPSSQGITETGITHQ